MSSEWLSDFEVAFVVNIAVALSLVGHGNALQTEVFLLCGMLMQLVPSKRAQGRYIVKMLWRAMRDGYAGRLGKNEQYMP